MAYNENDHPRNQDGTWTDKEGSGPSGDGDLNGNGSTETLIQTTPKPSLPYDDWQARATLILGGLNGGGFNGEADKEPLIDQRVDTDDVIDPFTLPYGNPEEMGKALDGHVVEFNDSTNMRRLGIYQYSKDDDLSVDKRTTIYDPLTGKNLDLAKVSVSKNLTQKITPTEMECLRDLNDPDFDPTVCPEPDPSATVGDVRNDLTSFDVMKCGDSKNELVRAAFMGNPNIDDKVLSGMVASSDSDQLDQILRTHPKKTLNSRAAMDRKGFLDPKKLRVVFDRGSANDSFCKSLTSELLRKRSIGHENAACREMAAILYENHRDGGDPDGAIDYWESHGIKPDVNPYLKKGPSKPSLGELLNKINDPSKPLRYSLARDAIAKGNWSTEDIKREINSPNQSKVGQVTARRMLREQRRKNLRRLPLIGRLFG